jgi:hypothetical protein
VQSSSSGCIYLNRVQRSSVGSALGCYKAGQGSIPFLVRHPMEVFLAEKTSDEETLAVTSKCRNAGEKVSPASAFLRLVNGVSHSGIRVSTVPLFTDLSAIAQLWLLPMFDRISCMV